MTEDEAYIHKLGSKSNRNAPNITRKMVTKVCRGEVLSEDELVAIKGTIDTCWRTGGDEGGGFAEIIAQLSYGKCSTVVDAKEAGYRNLNALCFALWCSKYNIVLSANHFAWMQDVEFVMDKHLTDNSEDIERTLRSGYVIWLRTVPTRCLDELLKPEPIYNIYTLLGLYQHVGWTDRERESLMKVLNTPEYKNTEIYKKHLTQLCSQGYNPNTQYTEEAIC